MQQTHSIRRNGFTLVEVLVALLVLSIGLLGVGKLVLFSARANDSAYMRSQATALGYSILDAMRANRQTALTQGYDIGAASGAANPGTTCSVACTTALLAQADLWNWKNRLQTALGPTGDGSVQTVSVLNPVTGTSAVTATVIVQWDDRVASQTFGGPAALGVVTLETVL